MKETAAKETQLVNVREGILLVCKIPGDGNCLFTSLPLAHQIWRSLPVTKLNAFHTRTLRALAANYYRERIGSMKEQLSAQAQIIFLELEGKMSTDQLIGHYLDKLATPGFWGGEESIRAVAATFGYRISVYSENASRIIIGKSGPQGEHLSIVHRVDEYGIYNHFDSVLRPAENGEPPRAKRRMNPTPGNTDKYKIPTIAHLTTYSYLSSLPLISQQDCNHLHKLLPR